ncbi:pre-mRNA-splicing regulator WTAP [Pelomyxa schiedti]|nr:pre-mRNA-splicing regulator WTAP [Pelomyxa schiedti]
MAGLTTTQRPAAIDAIMGGVSTTTLVRSTPTASTNSNSTIEDYKRRECVMVQRLAAKENQIVELQAQLGALKAKLSSGTHTNLVDPVVNSNYVTMRERLEEREAKVKSLEEELEHYRTQQGLYAVKLQSRLKIFQQENEELGKQVEEGSVATLKQELAVYRARADESAQTIRDYATFVEHLQAESVLAQHEIISLRVENTQLRTQLAAQATTLIPPMNSPPIVNSTNPPADNTVVSVNTLSVNDSTNSNSSASVSTTSPNNGNP